MFALVGRDQRQLQRVRAALADVEWAVAAEDLHAFRPATVDAECLIVVSNGLHGEDVAADLRTLTELFPLLPAVVIAQKELRPALAHRQSPVEVLGLETVEHALRPAMNRARCRAALGRLAITLERASNIPQRLRAALAYACRCDPPVRHVGSLARATGCDRSSLWREWHATLGDALSASSCTRLEDFLHWVVLLRAITRKTPHRSWFAVSEELHLHQHTLARLARRLTNKPLRDLEASEPLSILTLFAQSVIELLVDKEVLRSTALGTSSATNCCCPD